MSDKIDWDNGAITPPAGANTNTDWDNGEIQAPSASEKDGAFIRGLKRAKQSATITTKLATGDTAGTAETIRDAEIYNQQNPSSKESDELSKAWEDGDGITGGIAGVGREFAKDWRESKGFVSGLRETGKNVNALREGIVSQLGNSVAPMVGLVAGGAAGAAAGTAVPVVGNIAGGIAGGWAGAAAGNTLVEGGGQLQDALHKANIDPMDTVAVEKFVAENGDKILGQSAIKGGIIGAVDTATAGIAGRLLNVPARAAVNRALVDMGVDVADKIAVKEAMKNSAAEISSRLASDTAYQASRTGAENIARNAGAAALDPAGEFTGEYVGQGAATGDWNTKNAALEALSSVGQSGAMFAGQKGYQALTNPFRNGKTGEAAPQSNTPITDAAQATGAFPQLPAPSITVNADGTAETAEDRNARIAARAAGDIADVTPIPNTPEYQDVRGFAPAARQTQALEAPTIIVDGNGQALTAQDRNNRLSDRLSGGVTDVTPIQRAPEVIPPSRAMGLTPANGSLSGAAAMAVDSGASVFGSISQQGALNGQQTQEAQQTGEGQSQGGGATGGAAPKTRAVKTRTGEIVLVNESDFTSGAKSLRTFTADGKPRAARLDAANIAPPPPKVVLQNRDRSTSASIQQMNDIVAQPDFLKAGTSSTMDRGAPMVFGDLPSKLIVGRTQQVADDSGKRIPTNYAVVEADDLLASNNADGTTNNEYAEGVPGKLRAVAGNGRVAGLQEAWNRGTTGGYAADLAQEAESLGIDPQALAGFSRPVLVRVMDEADVTADIGDRSNIQSNLQLSVLERAGNDVRRMDLRDMEFNDKGNPTSDTMRQFMAAMPTQERGDMLDKQGLPTLQLIDRIKAAAFKQAYMSDSLVELATQSVNDDAKRILNALTMAAGDMVQLDGTGEFDIRQAVADAAGLAVNAAKKGEKLSDYLRTVQIDESPEAIAVARFFEQNSGSANQIADGLRAWANLAKSQVEAARANADQGSMFGETPTLSRNQLFERLSDENITDIEREQLIAQQERAKSIEQSADAESAERAGDADSAPDSEGSSEEIETESFALDQQTPQELQALEEEQAALQQELEQEQRDAEAADRAKQTRDEVTRRSEAAADNFQLGQSAEDSLSGQGDIFAQQQEATPEAPPKTLKEGLERVRAKKAAEKPAKNDATRLGSGATGVADNALSGKDAGAPYQYFEEKTGLIRDVPSMSNRDGTLNDDGKRLAYTEWSAMSEDERALIHEAIAARKTRSQQADDSVRKEYLRAEKARLEGGRIILSSNGNPYKTEGAAAKFIEEKGIEESHYAGKVDGGWAAVRRTPSEMLERENGKKGIEDYTTIQSRVVAEMGLTQAWGEDAITDAQWEKIDNRVDAIQRGQRGLPPVEQATDEAKPAPDKDGNTIVGRRADGVMIRQDKQGVRFYFDSGVRISEAVSLRPTRAGMQIDRGELKPDFMTAEESAERDDEKPKQTEAATGNVQQAIRDAVQTDHLTNEQVDQVAAIFDRAENQAKNEQPNTVAATEPKTVSIPQDIYEALTKDMQKQQARVKRLRAQAEASDLDLEGKKAAQLKVSAAEATLRKMRTSRFDAEDAALASIEAGSADSFAHHADFFPSVSEVLAKNFDRAEGKAKKEAKPAPAAKPPSADKTRAKADLMNALADLGDILGKGNKLFIVPEQEQKLLPVLARVLDAAFRLGYHKFKDASKFALDQMRKHLGDEAADALTIDHLQGAYIAMAGGKKGVDTKRAVIDVETKAEIESHEAVAVDEDGDDSAEPQPINKALPAPAAPKTLAESLFSAIKDGRMPKDNPALKKLVEAFDGRPADQARMKEGQEELETAIVMASREIVANKESDQSTFETLLRLYESQPNLNIRTSTSIANQAYSTPAPLAYLASRLAGITQSTVVHEPTGGTGMLLIGADPQKSIVNELNDLRIATLKSQGFKPTQKDAATQLLVPDGTQTDAVVTNPPFGSLKDGEGKTVKVRVDGFNLGQIDHLIAARALNTLKDDGRATLILGANKVAGGLSTDDRIFFNWLYSNYSVVGHFEVNGDLYTRQGAGWPVRVITINGRKKSSGISPLAGTIQRADNWDQVYEQFTKNIASADAPRNTAKQDAVEAGGKPTTTVATPQAASGQRPKNGTRGDGNVAGAVTRNVPDSAKPDGGAVGTVADEQRINAQSYVPKPQQGQGDAGGDRPSQPTRDAALENQGAAGNEFQSPYTPRSSRKDEGVLIPANMAQPTQDALNRIEDAVGDIDEYARSELGYDTVADLHNALMGLQVDSVATAIYQIKQGKAVVIADQTGIGKGRQAASIIRWAAKQGLTPVFVSVKPSLFTDMYGDLADIGTNDVSPFIMNSAEWIAGEGGEKLFTNKPADHKRTIEGIASTAELPDGSNAVFLTYSQINVANAQRRALMALAPNAVFILDESHNAAGASATGEFMIGALDAAKGVVYLSATYAKRPDNMPLYFKTDIGEAAADTEGLALAMASGGLPLQTVVSNNLVKAGQMFRRERSYDGVSIESIFDTPNKDLHERMSDEATKALRAIVAADRMFHNVFVKAMSDELAEQGATVQDSAGNQIDAGVEHTEFSSVVHNFVKQMLLGLKAQPAADSAIASLKRGEKPIIAVESTMGSFLNEYAASNGIAQGASLGAFDYRTVLTRALSRSRVIIEVTPGGDKVKRAIPLGALDAVTRAAYDDAQAVIDGLTLNIPVSPIDWMRAEIQRAGFSVAEITGRNLSVDYSDPKNPILSALDQSEQKDKVNTTRQFNSGKLDALVLNVAGSTGISLHASEKFEDQRQRHMIVAQAAGDINIFMQMLGRVHRTGQVRLPKYSILSADLPTEKRPTAVLSNKMKSLNANTSSNTESATSVKSSDILNKYGDQIVNQYLIDNYPLAVELDLTKSIGTDFDEDLARKATGRLALQPIATQNTFYEEVESQYASLIEYLNKTNQNDLDPRTFDFDAKETRQEVLFDGPDKSTPFGEDAIYGEYSIKAQGTPMKPEEIHSTMAVNLGGLTSDAHAQKMLSDLDAKYNTYYASLEDMGKDSAISVRNAGRDFVERHKIGSMFRVDINGEPFNAVVLNVRNLHKESGNPYSMSKMQVSVAINGAIRSLSVPATQFSKIEVSTVAAFFKVEQLFKEQPPNQRETAKIVTGNLLAAYGELKGVRGTIITFTKNDGTSEQGILLPKLFDYNKNTQGDYRLKTSADALKFLQTSDSRDIGRFGISSRDGVVRVLPYGKGIRVQVPKSKLRGAKYFLDKGLIDAGGDFVSSGGLMVATIEDAGKARQVLDLLSKKQALYALPSMAEEAKAMLEKQDPASSRANPKDSSAESDDISEFGTKPKAKDGKKGTPTDRAVMDMVREGKATDDVLKLILGTSRSRFNKQLARLLLKTGALPKLEMTADLGSSKGFKRMAKYSHKNNVISMAEAASGRAEQIFLHELVHAATMTALNNKSLSSVQMRVLFNSVRKQGGAAGKYGMTNVAEFVSEAFTNPDFQKTLKSMSAPAQSNLKSAWDYFVRILKSILGLPNDSTDALSAALEIGVSLMREDMSLRKRGAQGKGKDVNAGIDQSLALDVRPPNQSVTKAAAALSTATKIVGNKTISISELKGGVGREAGDLKRVAELVKQMSSPDGYIERLIVDDAGNVIEGQHRLEALREMGVKDVPVVVIQDFERNFPMERVKRILRDAQKTNPDNINALAANLAEIYAEEKGDAESMREYETPVGFEKAWDAGLNYLSNNGGFSVENDDIAFYGEAEEGAGTWQAPEATKYDKYTYLLQDKQIDSKRVINAILDTGKQIADDLDVYLQETLFHGRAAKRVKDFAELEELPLMNLIRDNGLTMAQVEEYLHARHAPEANKVLSERNPNQSMIDEGRKQSADEIKQLQAEVDKSPTDLDLRKKLAEAEAEAAKWRNAKPYQGKEEDRLALSGMSDEEATAVMDSLDDTKRKSLQDAAKLVDGIIAKTRETIVDYGLESQDTVDAWGRSWDNYVPLMREQLDDVLMGGMGTGQGFSVKGKETKGRTGSTKKVVDILANINMQRELAIVRGEKNRVATALLGLVKDNPNKDFWHIAEPGEIPSTQVIDKKTGLVTTQIDPLFKSRDNALIAKVNGVEKVIIFNKNDKRATRMAVALKNMDAANLEGLLGSVASATRYLAAVNTQYNPIFGIVNMVRDFQEAAINLQATPLAGKQKQVLGQALNAVWQVGKELRAQREGKTTGSEWGKLWEDFQAHGGQTGYRDMFTNSADRSKALQALLQPDAWADTKWGKFFSANGTLKAPMEFVRRTALRPLLDLLSDYNEAIENGVRLSAYKAALDIGMSKPRAAELAKNLTVNFNRKGQVAQQVGALYAFFNASVQGAARMGQTIFDMEPGKPKTIRLSSLGKKIVGGGVLLGSVQALLLAASGFGDDEPPEFIRKRNLVIPNPLSEKGYISIPMPLGYHVLTNLGRIPTEYALSGFKGGSKRAISLLDVMSDIYNPIGGSGLSMQTLAPSVLDPFAALAENKDFTGRAIAKQSFNKVTPGHALGRDTSTLLAQGMSKAVNYATGGTEYTRGELSPTPDQIDYLIGQVTGGVGREASKVSQSTQAIATGDELPWHKVPLVGRFYGDADSPSAKQSAYYNLMDDVRRHSAEVKGLRNDGKATEAIEYMAENPQATLHIAANAAERQVKKLRDRMDDLKEQNAPRESIKEVETQMTEVMQRFAALVQSKKKP